MTRRTGWRHWSPRRRRRFLSTLSITAALIAIVTWLVVAPSPADQSQSDHQASGVATQGSSAPGPLSPLTLGPPIPPLT